MYEIFPLESATRDWDFGCRAGGGGERVVAARGGMGLLGGEEEGEDDFLEEGMHHVCIGFVDGDGDTPRGGGRKSEGSVIVLCIHLLSDGSAALVIGMGLLSSAPVGFLSMGTGGSVPSFCSLVVVYLISYILGVSTADRSATLKCSMGILRCCWW